MNKVASSAKSSDAIGPVRLSIACADLKGLPIPALRYSILLLNTLQKDVEFQFVQIPEEDTFLPWLSSCPEIPDTEFHKRANKFIHQLSIQLSLQADEWESSGPKTDHVLFVSTATHEDNLIGDWNLEYSAIFLGAWETQFAPPSLLEFIVSLIIMEGLYAALGEDALKISHLPTRGCPGDMTVELRDARYQVLQGFLCSDCRSVVEHILGEQKAASWELLLNKAWLGSMKDPTSPASVIKKLGYDMFLTKGFTPSRTEKLLAGLEEEGVKMAFKITGGLILTVLLIWLGW